MTTQPTPTTQQISAQLGQWTTPEACLKRAEELYKLDNNWNEALATLHVGL